MYLVRIYLYTVCPYRMTVTIMISIVCISMIYRVALPFGYWNYEQKNINSNGHGTNNPERLPSGSLEFKNDGKDEATQVAKTSHNARHDTLQSNDQTTDFRYVIAKNPHYCKSYSAEPEKNLPHCLLRRKWQTGRTHP